MIAAWLRDGTYQVGAQSLQLDVDAWAHLDVVDAGDADIVPAWLDRGHAMIFEKVLEVAASGAVPIVLGGDHSITWPSASAVAQVHAPRSVGIVHFDAHADAADSSWGVLAGHGTPMRRLIESGAEGIVLGCTELPFLLSDADCDVPVFDTTAIHCEKALSVAIGE